MKFFTKATFLRSATEESQFFTSHLKEVILVGRSNVGKSSLINHFLQKKGLAKTSSVPGKTQAVNFFNVEDRFILVDLPGFGYAKVSHEIRNRWGESIEQFFAKCSPHSLILFLLDIRRIPSEEDLAFCNWARARGQKISFILTKADKLKQEEQNKAEALILKTLKIENECTPLLYSIHNPLSRVLLHQLIHSYLEGAARETDR